MRVHGVSDDRLLEFWQPKTTTDSPALAETPDAGPRKVKEYDPDDNVFMPPNCGMSDAEAEKALDELLRH